MVLLMGDKNLFIPYYEFFVLSFDFWILHFIQFTTVAWHLGDDSEQHYFPLLIIIILTMTAFYFLRWFTKCVPSAEGSEWIIPLLPLSLMLSLILVLSDNHAVRRTKFMVAGQRFLYLIETGSEILLWNIIYCWLFQ